MAEAKYEPRSRKNTRSVSVKAMRRQFGYKNEMHVPRIDKIVINMGVGEADCRPKKVDRTLLPTSPRSPARSRSSPRRATRSPASRCARTCRSAQGHAAQGARMYEFMDRLVNIALPRVRDFRGLNRRASTAVATFAMGIKEHIVFPEINYDKVDQMWGMDIIVCTTAKTDDEARALADRVQLPVPAVTVTRASERGTRREMAKKSAVEKNKRRRKVAQACAGKRARLEGDHLQ
jgi:large subunit ribosomal protein L5